MTKPHHVATAKAIAAAAEEGANLDELVEVTLTGGAAWYVPNPEGAGKAPLHTTGAKGETVTMPRREAIRLEVLGYIAQPAAAVVDALPADTPAEELEDLEALAAGATPADPSPATTADTPAAPAAGLEAFLPGAAAGDPDVSTLTDEDLAGLDAGALVAHVGQFPGDVDRVRDLELARKPSSRRATVLAATGMTEAEVTTARSSK